MERSKRIVVVGGGYAGVLAANRLVGRVPKGTEIRLLCPGDTLVHRVRLHEMAARGTDVEIGLRSLLHPEVVLDQAMLVGLDAQGSALVVARGTARTSLAYGHAVLAIGSTLHAASGDAACDAVSSVASAKRFHARLRTLPPGAHVVVLGGGLTGIELVTEIAEAHPALRTTLVAHRMLPDIGAAARRALLDAFAALSITVVEGHRATASGGRVVLDDGREIEADLCAVCDGFRVTEVARALGLKAADDGRLRVDSSLRVEGFANLFAVGDVAAPPSETIGRGVGTTRMGCATAMPMGAHAADEIAGALRGESARPFGFGYALRCVSLGRRRGLVLFTDKDDRPARRYYSGPFGAMIKEVICRFVIGMLRLEARWSGAYAWPRAHRPALREPMPPLLPR